MKKRTQRRESREIIIITGIAIGIPVLILLSETGWMPACFISNPSIWTFAKPVSFVSYVAAAFLSYLCLKATRIPSIWEGVFGSLSNERI